MKKVLTWLLADTYSNYGVFAGAMVLCAIIDERWFVALALFVILSIAEGLLQKAWGKIGKAGAVNPVDHHPGDDLLDESGQGFFLVWDGDEFDWPHVRQYSRSRKEGRSKGWNCSGVTHWMPIPKAGDA